MLTIPERESIGSKFRLTVLLVIAALSISIIIWFISIQLFSEQTSKLELSVAEYGSVEQKLTVFGRLTPRVSTSLVAQVDGHVSQINVLPGSQVKSNTTIVTLANPQLLRQSQIATLNWQKAQAHHVSALAKLKRDETQLQNDVAIASSELQFAEREIQTLSTLHKENLLSELDFLRANTRLEQLRLKLDLTKRSEMAFQETYKYEKQALDLELESEKQLLAMTQDDIANLLVRATQPGILTELLEGVEVGQAVSKGTVLAKLSNKNSLFAQLLAPASAIEMLVPGLPVNIKIKGKSYAASIVRVHPNVEANQIKFEARFTSSVPPSAVNNLSVSAEVLLANIPNTLRIVKPLYLEAQNNQQALYVYNGERVVKRIVTIGLQGTEFIEVLAGLEVGEQVLKALPQSKSL